MPDEGPVVQPGRTLPWHGRGPGFKSQPVHLKGSYALLIETPKKAEIGSIGVKKFKKPYAVYGGSAFGPGGLKRVKRHFEKSLGEKKTHWHIDYLLKTGELEKAWLFPGQDMECKVSEIVDGDPVQGFGASDCSCSSHLIETGERPSGLEKRSEIVVTRGDFEEFRGRGEAWEEFLKGLKTSH